MASKFLRRFLERGESLRVIGEKGKPVKRPRSGRKYIVEIRVKNKTVAYANSQKSGKPQPREFTSSMLARLRAARTQRIHERPKAGGDFKLSSKRKIKSQISKAMLARIRRNKGKAFNFRITHGRNRYLTHSIYIGGRLTDTELRNLITSDILYTLSRENYRISPKPENIKDKKKIKRIKTAELQLQFTRIEHGKNREGKNERKSRRKRRLSQRERTRGRL